MGYTLRKIQKTLKKIPETDAIFDNLKEVHNEIKNHDNILRISIDTKDRVKIGQFSRGGQFYWKINHKKLFLGKWVIILKFSQN
ncbi:rhodopirellula transposase [Clostridium tepidiprofundi DSM 19306]|uniref:Rhodopirellula transposase n=1 Tax=Clostridium tepidiprofundi DSM 19306 TaxID=1121338 RepID=A0A151ASA3_9CLOT|nr:hypothetical protein [Clostridium tepidiprofundi]KYH30531.1 rhodopirellula transposase [Clostridium tepidiprofundi DSM 19306]